MQNSITDLFSIWESYRTERIARTETIRASNAGSRELFQEWGVQKHEWLSTKDDRTRTYDNTDGKYDHLEADGQVVNIDEPFTVSGESLMFPGDPAGDPGNTINCVIGNTNIMSLGSIEAVTKREYTGKVITITTATGNNLTVTPNHPILTRKGFTPAQFLNKGDDLLGGALCKTYLIGQPNVDYRPARIEEIYDALSISFVGQRIVMGVMDFHGDGIDGYVNVITTDGILSNRIKVSDSERIKNGLFFDSNLPCFELIVDSAMFASSLDNFGAISLDRSGGMGGSCHLNSLSRSHLSHFEPVSFTSPANLYTSGNQAWANGSSSESEYLRQLFLADAIDIHSDKIIGIDVVPFSGHVYNLQSKSGMYLANGIITHNCRCTTIPVVEGME